MKFFKWSVAASVALLPVTAYAQDRIAGQVVVDAVDTLSEDDQRQLERDISALFPSISFTESALEDETKIEIGHLDASDVDRVISAFASDGRIQHIEPVFEMKAFGLKNFKPNDPIYNKQWYLPYIGTEDAHGYASGKGVVVSVVDTGVSCTARNGYGVITDFKHIKCREGYSVFTKDNNTYDAQGHGTFCAAEILAAFNNSVGGASAAYSAELLPVKVLDDNGSGSTVGVADGIRWAAEHGADVISMSLGGGGSSQVMIDALQVAFDRGVVVVAANGNDSGPVNYPAAHDGVIAVSATNEKSTITDFSSRGPQTFLGAPGDNITAQTICGARGSNPGKGDCEDFQTWRGTSMATPLVAAGAAVLMSQGITNPERIKERLADSATKTEKTRTNPNHYGHGILNIGNAVAQENRSQAFARFATLMVLSWWLYRKTDQKRSWKFAVPAFLVGVGLFFVPMLVAYPHPLIQALTRPLMELPNLLSVRAVPLFALVSALFSGALLIVSWHLERFRKVVSGISLGMCSYLLSSLVLGTMFFPVGATLGTILLLANALVSYHVARFTLKHSV